MRRVLFLFAACGALLARGAAPGGSGEEREARLSVEPVGAIYGFFSEGPFQQPSGVFFDPVRRELFVCDMAARRIAIANERAIPTFSVGSDRSLVTPRRLVVDAEGRILILDGAFEGLRVLDYDGTVLPDFDLSAVPHADAPLRIGAIAISPAGTLFAADVANHRVLAIDPQGRVRAFGPPRGREDLLANPLDLDFLPDGSLVVADGSGLAVQVYDPEGKLLRAWGKHEAGPLEFSLPGGLAVDGEGRIFITDTLRQDVKVFSSTGEFLTRFGGYGAGPGALRYPVDVASDRNGRVFVSERVGRRVQVFRVRDR